jgi:ribosomal protein L29
MKASELRLKSIPELKVQIHNDYKDMFELRSKSASGQVPNARLMRTLKKDVARCLTLITETERAGAAKS